VTDPKRHLRSLVIAFAVLTLSAGAVMADRGTHPGPTDTAGADAAQGDQGDEATEAPETEAPETEAPETEAPKPVDTQAADGGTAPIIPATPPDNHGAVVSAAAQTATPTGFANHGAYVRSIAMANHGHDPLRTRPTHGGPH